MNAAKVGDSARLQRVLEVLQSGEPVSTRDIMERARVCAVSACVAELRANGYVIPPPQRRDGNYYYQMAPQAQQAAA